MRHIACTIAYDGTDFAGSQRQKNGRSVQGELERALEQVLKHPATRTGSQHFKERCEMCRGWQSRAATLIAFAALQARTTTADMAT